MSLRGLWKCKPRWRPIQHTHIPALPRPPPPPPEVPQYVIGGRFFGGTGTSGGGSPASPFALACRAEFVVSGTESAQQIVCKLLLEEFERFGGMCGGAEDSDGTAEGKAGVHAV